MKHFRAYSLRFRALSSLLVHCPRAGGSSAPYALRQERALRKFSAAEAERAGDEPGDEPPTGGAPDEPGKLLLSNSIMWELEPVGGSGSNF